jgi:hypothetical protein
MAKWQRTKRIQGKNFHFYSAHATKTGAKLAAARRRDKGDRARVVRTTRGWEVYSR